MSIDTLDSVYTVWQEGPPGSSILFKRNIISFERSIDLNLFNTGTSALAVAASGNNVYVVWDDISPNAGRIFYRNSTDGGADFFGSITDLSNAAGTSRTPAVAASGNNLYVVWDNNSLGNSDIFYRRNTGGGSHLDFDSIVNLSNTAGTSRTPAVAASGNNLYVVWDDNSLGNSDIFYTRSTDGGANFGDIVNLSNIGGDSITPAVAASGNNVYVVWDNNAPGNGNFDILYTRSTDGGANFGSTVNLSNTIGDEGTPAVAASGNNVYVVWVENNGPQGGGDNTLYRRSTDGGASFSDIVNLSNTTVQARNPAVAVSNNLT